MILDGAISKTPGQYFLAAGIVVDDKNTVNIVGHMFAKVEISRRSAPREMQLDEGVCGAREARHEQHSEVARNFGE